MGQDAREQEQQHQQPPPSSPYLCSVMLPPHSLPTVLPSPPPPASFHPSARPFAPHLTPPPTPLPPPTPAQCRAPSPQASTAPDPPVQPAFRLTCLCSPLPRSSPPPYLCSAMLPPHRLSLLLAQLSNPSTSPHPSARPFPPPPPPLTCAVPCSLPTGFHCSCPSCRLVQVVRSCTRVATQGWRQRLRAVPRSHLSVNSVGRGEGGVGGSGQASAGCEQCGRAVARSHLSVNSVGREGKLFRQEQTEHTWCNRPEGGALAKGNGRASPRGKQRPQTMRLGHMT